MPEALKVLLYDLETAPILAYGWSPGDQWIPSERLIHSSFVLAWSAKWRGQKKVYSGVLTGAEARDQDDTRIIGDLAALIREADFVVAHNGDKFDLPMFNGRLLALGLEPMGPKRTIDTLKLARKNFRLPYNKLDWLGEYLGLGRKLPTNFALWRDCYHGDEKALGRMSRYNRQDVVLLESVFERMLPYVKGLPRLVDATDVGESACPHCASTNLQRRGRAHTNAGSYHRWHCKDCGLYSRNRTVIPFKLATVPL